MNSMSNLAETELLLSCLGGDYEKEWKSLCTEIVIFKYARYKARCDAYAHTESIQPNI